ncbi:hypothetical protein Acr_10g0002190 [Actinidia rufa]|uniref:Uncharacterized protein n=1 Tax=Actinidia rufa TaxID=165716 RepID=A0A7J0F807_9ERIC|nr:hypothetical protein Acr_10g0002190 [Actinidia rufa]
MGVDRLELRCDQRAEERGGGCEIGEGFEELVEEGDEGLEMERRRAEAWEEEREWGRLDEREGWETEGLGSGWRGGGGCGRGTGGFCGGLGVFRCGLTAEVGRWWWREKWGAKAEARSIGDQAFLVFPMGAVVNYLGMCRQWRVRLPSFRIVSSFDRWKVLEQVDEQLSKGEERAALSLLKANPGELLCFGAARQVPQRLYSLDELKLNGIETSALLSPVDVTLGSIERNLQLAALLGGISAWNVYGFNPQQVLYFSLGLLFLGTVDSHEAGHFLIAYLLGILPRGYTLSSLEALKKEGSLNVQAGTALWILSFLKKFSCIALAGVATEYLLYGCAEGGLADIYKLDTLLKGLGFTQKKADSQVRWAVLNTVLTLRRHERARAKLAEAMSEGRSVGFCIDIIETNIDAADI